MLTYISRKTVSYILYAGKSGAIGRERVGDYNMKTGVCFRCGTVFVCLVLVVIASRFVFYIICII